MKNKNKNKNNVKGSTTLTLLESLNILKHSKIKDSWFIKVHLIEKVQVKIQEEIKNVEHEIQPFHTLKIEKDLIKLINKDFELEFIHLQTSFILRKIKGIGLEFNSIQTTFITRRINQCVLDYFDILVKFYNYEKERLALDYFSVLVSLFSYEKERLVLDLKILILEKGLNRVKTKTQEIASEVKIRLMEIDFVSFYNNAEVLEQEIENWKTNDLKRQGNIVDENKEEWNKTVEDLKIVPKEKLEEPFTFCTTDYRMKAYISDENKSFLIHDIYFIKNKANGMIVRFKNVEKPALTIKNVISFLESIDSYKNKGYINETCIDFLDDMKLKLDYGLVLEEKEGLIFNLKPDTEFYRWFLNLLYLSIYKALIILQNKILKETPILAVNDDLNEDLKTIIRKIYDRIHPLITTKIQKKGISVALNIYNGFDTEYELEDEARYKNKLLSRQIALNTRMIIKLPLVEVFNLGYIDPLTSEVRERELLTTGGLMGVIFDIRKLIEEIRGIKFQKYDDFISVFRKKLKEVDETGNEFRVIKDFKSKGYEVFIFNLTEMKKCFKKLNEYSFNELIQDTKYLGEENLIAWVKHFIYLLSEVKLITSKEENVEMIEDGLEGSLGITSIDKRIEMVLRKNKTRWTVPLNKTEEITVSFSKCVFICCHFTNADLSMLKDFEKMKHQLDIVHKNFITLGRGLIIENVKVLIRDTSLLAPPGGRSLEKIGEMYGADFNKVKIPDHYRSKMGKLLTEDEELFTKYAIQDSVVTLKHANSMEEFYMDMKRTGVPITISSIGNLYVKNQWNGFTYQKSKNVLLGDTHDLNTPQGLNLWKNAGLFLTHFIGNYKGGRNESFMYGYEKENYWYDYDLNGAYTTVLAFLGTPDYNKCKVINSGWIENLKESDFFNYYLIVKVSFEFPETVKYPSIPCFLDKTTTVYPLKGEALLTGPEFLLAKNQGCKIKVFHGVSMPFLRADNKNGLLHKPFYDIINNLQKLRRMQPKGTLRNLLYKLLGNGIYGSLVRGISMKKLFDIKTNSMKHITANELSNPILGSYTTALVRCVIGESLHLIQEMGGKVVSVTTDGFITDIENLELKLLDIKGKTPFLNLFRRIRKNLSGDESAYETKNEGEGIITWATRGQLGIGSNIQAATGFQTGGYSHDYLVEKFIEAMEGDKQFEFIQKSLREGNEMYKKGGQVTMIYKERDFNLRYDNRRLIIENKDQKLLDSAPLPDIKEGRVLRELGKITNEKVFNKMMTKRGGKTYKTVLDSAVRTFIKGLLAEDPLFGLENYKKDFKSYNDIVLFIKGCGVKDTRLTKSSISNLKHRKLKIKLVDRTEEIEEFVSNVKNKLPLFKEKDFYKNG